MTLRIGFIGSALSAVISPAACCAPASRSRCTTWMRLGSTRHVGAGARWAQTPGALGGAVDCVITCLPSPAISEAVLREVLQKLKPGATWIENSTLGRDEMIRLAKIAGGKGVRMLEAPGHRRRASGRAARSPCWPAAMRISSTCTGRRSKPWAVDSSTWGPLGSAAIIKVITNMLAFIHLVADGEALMLAKRGGLDLAQAWQAITASSGTSFVHETEGQLILNGSYDIAFTMDLALRTSASPWNSARNSACRSISPA